MASIALIAAFVWLKGRADAYVELDPDTLCPVTGPTSVTAVIIDTTDPVLETPFEDLTNKYDKLIKNEVEPGGLIWVGTVTATPGELVGEYTGCNPGDASTVDDLTGNKRLRQRKWEEGYKKPLETALEQIRKSPGADQSPLMAAIQRVKIDLFDKGGNSDLPKRLIIASDMIEHTPEYSQYRSGADYSAYEASVASSRYRTDLLGAEVTVLYFNRPKKFASAAHAEFWAQWFQRNDGKLLEFVKVEGM